jgi:serine/threonine-protein kinase
MSHHEQVTTEETLAWSSDSTEAPVRDLTGAVLGDFQVQRLIGRGGMGQVYLATQISLNRPVALKVLHPRYTSKPAYLSRFEAEATAVAKLNHPNIVHVYTLGEIEHVRFIAMEYVEGTNLREYIQRKGALDIPLALSIMRQAGQAIGAAGEVGLVHRDIKPENLLLTRKGRAKVADFGLCRDLGADRSHITQPGITMGTPLYMSPEQAQGLPLDHRSDLYSLGVTFYHMLTGEPPFRADSAVALAMKHVHEQPVSLRLRRPEIPIELERLVLKLMAKNPADRYQSAGDMLVDLAKIRTALQATVGTIADENPLSLPRSDESPSSKGPASSVELSRLAAGSTSGRIARVIRPGALLLLSAVSMVIGGALGWSLRPAGPSSGLEAARRPPGLQLEPRWSKVPKQETAEEQYRLALFSTPAPDLGAAWLAVPGHFGHSPEWVSPAYIQYARGLYRQRDLDRLSAFKAELAAWPGAKTQDQELVPIIDAAIKLLNRDIEGVIQGMSRIAGSDDRARARVQDEPSLDDPGLLELSAEISSDALELAFAPGAGAGESKRDKLYGIQGRLLTFLRQVQTREWMGASQRRRTRP